jgi:hypothetical protein
MAVGEEEELERFEGCAEEGGGEKCAESEAQRKVVRYFGRPVFQWGEGQNEEEQSGEGSKDREVSEVAVPVGPLP